MAKAEAAHLVAVIQAGLQAFPLGSAGSTHPGVSTTPLAAAAPFPNIKGAITGPKGAGYSPGTMEHHCF